LATQYCSKCGFGVMPTMRICPSCGNRTFAQTPPNPSSAMSQRGQASLVPNPAAPVHSAQSSGHSSFGPVTTFTPAGHGKRLFAYLIDCLTLLFGAGVIFGVGGLIGSGSNSMQATFSGGVLLLLGAVLPFVYYTILHSRPAGASWGKAAMGLRVVTVAGEILTPIQAFTRCLLTLLVPVAGWILIFLTAAGTLGSESETLKAVVGLTIIIGVLCISFGPYLTVFFNPQRQTLFDLICKTCVIRTR
jgi:uncharacterized RDD family membrane protein YckC